MQWNDSVQWKLLLPCFDWQCDYKEGNPVWWNVTHSKLAGYGIIENKLHVQRIRLHKCNWGEFSLNYKLM